MQWTGCLVCRHWGRDGCWLWPKLQTACCLLCVLPSTLCAPATCCAPAQHCTCITLSSGMPADLESTPVSGYWAVFLAVGCGVRSYVCTLPWVLAQSAAHEGAGSGTPCFAELRIILPAGCVLGLGPPCGRLRFRQPGGGPFRSHFQVRQEEPLAALWGQQAVVACASCSAHCTLPECLRVLLSCLRRLSVVGCIACLLLLCHHRPVAALSTMYDGQVVCCS